MGRNGKSRFRKLELGMGMELTWENRERLEWKGKRMGKRERGSVPWSKRKAPRIRNDGSLNLVWERRERKLELKWNGKGS